MPSQSPTRRDPQKGKKGFSKNKGFTVIELMIVVATVAIILSLALPSYRTIIEKRAVSSGAEQVMAFLSSAQVEAVKRNRFVAVNYQWNDGNWCLGMTEGRNDAVDCDCSVADSCLLDEGDANEQERVLWSSVLNRPEVLSAATLGTGDANTLVFDPVRGLVVDTESAQVQLSSPDGETYALHVNMTATGRVDICNDNDRAGKVVPGYEDC